VLNDAASIYFLDTTLAGAFVARWCAGYRVETAGGVFQVRDDGRAYALKGATQRAAAPPAERLSAAAVDVKRRGGAAQFLVSTGNVSTGNRLSASLAMPLSHIGR
jgi:hypothetical protein